MSADLAAALRARVRGAVHVSPAPDARWCTDFGRVRWGVPRVVVEARSEEDVAAVLALARAHGAPVTVRGAGHSCNGQTVSDGGVLLVYAAREAAPVVLGDDGRAEIAACAHWRDVERALNRAGRTVPVLADYLDLTVGGTLSVGCYGVDSVRHGAQVTHVERLRLVRPDGTASWCSPTEEPALFGASLAGLGQVGVISRVVLRTEPHRPVTALDVHHHGGLLEMADALAPLANAGTDGPGLFKALAARGRFVSTLGSTHDRWREALAAPVPVRLAARRRPRRLVVSRYRHLRSLTVSLWLRRFGGRRRVWADYVVDAGALGSFLAYLEQGPLRDPAVAGSLASVYVLAIRRRPLVPPLALEAGGSGSAPLAFGVGLYFMVPAGDEAGLGRVHAALAGCLERCVALAGRPYLYGAHALDRGTASLLYGAGLERLRALKRALDPADLFQPGVLP